MALKCWSCRGRGYISDGQLDDGRITGRETCPVCEGRGSQDITERITEAELVELLTGPTNYENAQRLAAYAFGHGSEYDNRV